MSEAPARPASAAASDPSASARTLGPLLVARLHGGLRAVRLYESSNQTLQQLIGECVSAIHALSEDGETTLVGMGDYFYLNGGRLKAQPAQVAMYRSLMAEFECRALGGLKFLPGLTGAELESFLRVMAVVRDPVAGEQLPELAAQKGLLHITPMRARDLAELKAASEDDSADPDAGERQRAQQTFWRAVFGTRGVLMRTAQTGRPALRQARRVVQPIVDNIMKNEYSIIGLTALKDHDEYTYAHCVNVSVISIGLGQALGLQRSVLAHLGVAALLHDMGKIAIPAEVLQKPGALTPEEWRLVHRHPLEGVRMISHLPGLSSLNVDVMQVCFQHHMTVDQEGYPRPKAGIAPAALSRIVAVADFFDAITAHRAYRRRPLSSFEALQLMLGSERRHFDPAVLWALVKTVGLYPAGSVLLTSSGHLVLSLSPNPDDPRRPNCRVLARPDGSFPPEDAPETWDPMPPDQSVVRVLQPEEHQVSGSALIVP